MGVSLFCLGMETGRLKEISLVTSQKIGRKRSTVQMRGKNSRLKMLASVLRSSEMKITEEAKDIWLSASSELKAEVSAYWKGKYDYLLPLSEVFWAQGFSQLKSSAICSRKMAGM